MPRDFANKIRQESKAKRRLKPVAKVKVWEPLTHSPCQQRSLQQLKAQSEPGAYLDANVNTFCIQDVEDSWGEPIPFVSGQPALADKVVHDALGGHDDGELLHQPAALRGSAVVSHLWGPERKHLLGKGHFSAWGRFTWQGRTQGLYNSITTNHSSREWRELWNSVIAMGGGDQVINCCAWGKPSLKKRNPRVDWAVVHEMCPVSCHSALYMLICSWQQTHLSTLTSLSTSVTTLESDYSKLYSQEGRCSSANTHMYYYKHFPHKSTYKWTKCMMLFLCFPSP